jgi:predicted nuclease of predicted toxin-antitoxin system
MKFLIDENVGESVIYYLTQQGYDIIVATTKELKSREDFFLLDYAFRENRIIITNDKDFGYLVYRQKVPTRGIILFRFVQESPSLKITALETILSKGPIQILNHFIVASEDKIRIRPIGK